jgi:hypothetical protein
MLYRYYNQVLGRSEVFRDVFAAGLQIWRRQARAIT